MWCFQKHFFNIYIYIHTDSFLTECTFLYILNKFLGDWMTTFFHGSVFYPTLKYHDTVYREFFASGNFGENDAWKVCYIFTESYFCYLKTYSRVYFSLCLFLAISGRSRSQRKLKPRKKFRIYGIVEIFSFSICPSGEIILMLVFQKFCQIWKGHIVLHIIKPIGLFTFLLVSRLASHTLCNG